MCSGSALQVIAEGGGEGGSERSYRGGYLGGVRGWGSGSATGGVSLKGNRGEEIGRGELGERRKGGGWLGRVGSRMLRVDRVLLCQV